MNSIDTIAHLAGVSKTTVSMVINGKAEQNRISKATQDKIAQIIAEQKFTPNLYARGLRLQSTKTVALVVPDFLNPFFNELSDHLMRCARLADYNLVVATTEDDPMIEKKVVEDLLSRSVEAIFLSSVLQSAFWDSFKSPIIYIDRKIENGFSVTTDNELGAYQLTEHFIKDGCRRIAFIGGNPLLSTSSERLTGYRNAHINHSISTNDELILQSEFTAAYGYQSAQSLFDGKANPPDAIFSASYVILEGVLRYFSEKSTAFSKTETPRLGTFDNHPLLDFLRYPVCSVQQNTQELAETAFSLFRTILNKTAQVQNSIIKPRLIIR